MAEPLSSPPPLSFFQLVVILYYQSQLMGIQKCVNKVQKRKEPEKT